MISPVGSDAETNDMACRIHAFHDGIVFGFLLVPGGIRKTDFKEIHFRIEPDFYFIGHKSSPALGLPVR